MRNLIIFAIVCVIGWQAYSKYEAKRVRSIPLAEEVWTPTARSEAPAPSIFRCDGRTHCSQMTSCAEATYFLKNCPGTKMDGDNDGVPCETQWCK